MTGPGGNDVGGCGNDGESNLLGPGRKSKRNWYVWRVASVNWSAVQ